MDASLDDGVADLHLHTTASDGTCGIDERLSQAAEHGLEAIAITDHDVIPERITDRITTIQGIDLIAGVEVRADARDTKVELLGYYVDPADETLQGILRSARQYRRERNRALVANLATATGLDLSYPRLREEAGGQLGRPHLAAKLVEAGVVEEISDAFDRFLGRDGEAYVPMDRVPAADAIDAIHESGGVVSLAHPGRIRADVAQVEAIVDDLVGTGLDALEVRYPYGTVRSDEYAELDVADAEKLAKRHDLLRTGGSDCHGPDSGKFRIGEVCLPATHLHDIRERATAS